MKPPVSSALQDYFLVGGAVCCVNPNSILIEVTLWLDVEGKPHKFVISIWVNGRQFTSKYSRIVRRIVFTSEVRPEFAELFDAIAEHDPDVRHNYERFFEWLDLFKQAQRDPFRRLVHVDLDQELALTASEVAFAIKLPIWEILRSRHHCATYRPDYLATLGDFLPERGRLKVFTLNYDLCVEDACRAQGVDVTTGFEPRIGRWSPSRFRASNTGINLCKLHGSLNWGLDDNLQDRRLIERYPPQWDKEPDLLLGPGPKLQHDDPFVSLYFEFHRALRSAKACVVIGYSFRDDHVKKPLMDVSRDGLTVIDVNPSNVDWGGTFDRYRKVCKGAREAFESGVIREAVASVIK